ncbi:MAG: DUF1573 domain-containing protein [Ginsengibacter sp.]
MKKNQLKQILLFFCFAGILYSCNIRNEKYRHEYLTTAKPHFEDSTTVQIIDSAYDFGKVTAGEKVIYNYRFKNTGTKPLVISSATASCGCTVPEKPEEPIKPGETGFLKVVFNTEGRVGPTLKTVTVISNAYPAFPPLKLTGEVENQK